MRVRLACECGSESGRPTRLAGTGVATQRAGLGAHCCGFPAGLLPGRVFATIRCCAVSRWCWHGSPVGSWTERFGPVRWTCVPCVRSCRDECRRRPWGRPPRSGRRRPRTCSDVAARSGWWPMPWGVHGSGFGCDVDSWGAASRPDQLSSGPAEAGSQPASRVGRGDPGLPDQQCQPDRRASGSQPWRGRTDHRTAPGLRLTIRADHLRQPATRATSTRS